MYVYRADKRIEDKKCSGCPTNLLLLSLMSFMSAAVVGCPPFTSSRGLAWSPVQDIYSGGDNVTFYCTRGNESGSHLRGSSWLECDNTTEEWTATEPTCFDTVCSLPASLSGGVDVAPKYSGYLVGEQVVFSCVNSSLLVTSSNTSTCQLEGTWTDPIPTCTEKWSIILSKISKMNLGSCGAPPVIDPFVSLAMCLHVGCPAYYTCYDRRETITCSENNTWTDFTGPCIETWCNAPMVLDNATYSTNTQPHAGWYSIGTRASYSCDSHLTLTGDPEITCLENGTWTEGEVFCFDNFSSTNSSLDDDIIWNDNSTTVAEPRYCLTPNDVIPNRTMRRYGSSLLYSCDAGYLLLGDSERRCLANGTWSGDAPTCAAPIPAVPAAPDPATPAFHWEQVFDAYSDWQGYYKYEHIEETFQFKVRSVQVDARESVTALIADEQTQFIVKGYQDQSGEIVMQMVRLLSTDSSPSPRFPSLDWFVRGHLMEHECSWSYVGRIHTNTPGFTTLHMSTQRNDVSEAMHCSEVSNATVGIVSVTLVCVVIITLAVLGFICVRRGTGLRSSVHRSLSTSFENPVYEYENKE